MLTPHHVLATLVACLAIPAGAQDVADRIYSGGPILTMEDAAPRAEAVATRDGRILAVGSAADLAALRGPDTEDVDLDGAALLPGFVDSHGHVVMGGLQALSANLLAPPDGEITDIEGLINELTDWTDANRDAVERANVIIGFGYDPAQLTEKRHPTRDELDRVSTEIPVIIVHQSGHFGVANSAALELVGIDRGTLAPPGGLIRKGADGAPNGVLEENAFFKALVGLLGGLGDKGLEQFTRAGADLWASFGYTTAQEGRAMPGTVNALRTVAESGGLAIDVAVYVDVLVDRDFVLAEMSDSYSDRLRVAGAKLTIDGSPQGFTALRDRPYFKPVGEYPLGYLGYAAATTDQIARAVDWAFANEVQILTHSNGEGATDILLAAIAAAEETHGPADRRPVLIHGQFLREDQLDSLHRLGVFPSLFPMHTFYWGDWHREHTVGPALVDDISPTGWALARGMRFGTHHDAPVAFPDSMRVLDATVTRRSRSGDIIGPDQRVDVMTALKAMTIWPAWQHFEEHDKGSLAPGKLADFVVVSDDPTAVDPEMLDSLTVLRTIKEDRVIYAAE